MARATRLSRPRRQALRQSQREAVGSSVMSGVCDNYLAAFALFLHATAQQVGWITAFPQLFGASSQLISVWLSRAGVRRTMLIVAGAAFQCMTIVVMLLLCVIDFSQAVTILVVAAVMFQAGSHFVQPQWRAAMVTLVPEERRGRFFARRSRITALASFAALAGGGIALHFADVLEATAVGFAALFAAALFGRVHSTRLLAGLRQFDDPDERPQRHSLRATLGELRSTLVNRNFRRFTLFVALMQGSVAIAGPFFSVHMLRNLGFSYIEFMAALAASITVQLVTLNSWGYIADHLGNRIVLVTTAFIVPTLPMLWIFSDNFWYIMAVQGLAGLAWGGFTLCASNYLYDLRPAGGELAIFSAVQGVISSVAIFGGALLGGFLAVSIPPTLDLGGITLQFDNTLYAVFALSSLLRLAVALVFTPRVAEMRLSQDATVNQVIYRFARFNPITGVVLDAIGAVRRKR